MDQFPGKEVSSMMTGADGAPPNYRHPLAAAVVRL